ncbi:hypothetical protein [Thermoactinospora rubra]|uniref:hypothetical protein n=1 Tax=Thermoactinospora rubra TaxID=1088767 RepID=UPI00197E234C|nr:hypothetical protein [Thermoactinospora rubra]
MTVAHDPADRARLTYAWGGDHWYLIDEPEPTVILINARVSQGRAYATAAEAEEAFWDGVVTSLTTGPAPLWRLWQSDRGRWWATRTVPFSRAAEEAGAHRTVDDHSWSDVRALIVEQEQRAMLADAEAARP